MEIIYSDDYDRKVERAIRLLQSIPQDTEIELSYSGGKDSDVILELAKMAGIPFRAIYKNTTIDPPGTIKHCKDKGVEIVQPKQSFFEIVKHNGPPTMWRRVCCKFLKEYKVLDRAIQGIRRSESVKRAKRYKEPEICRVYSAKEKVKLYLPILDWTDKDVERFIKERNIWCHPLYYDEIGRFRVERRLGCMGCPLKSDRGINDFLKHPKLLKKLISSTQYFLNKSPDCESVRKFGDAYGVTYNNLFCDSYDEFQTTMSPGLFGEQFNPEKAIKEYFGLCEN